MQGGNPPPYDPNNPYGAGQPPPVQSPYGYTPPPYGMGGPMMGPMGMPGAPYGVDPVTGIPFSDKSKVIAGILQLLLGGFGAGRFYTGHTAIAIAQICVCFFTCGVGVLWPMIDGVLMLTGRVTDSDGRPLRDGT